MRLGRVINVDYNANTVDVLFDGGGTVFQAMMVGSLASTLAGEWELPVLKSVKAKNGTIMGMDGNKRTDSNITPYENTQAGKLDIDDPTLNYAYAVVVKSDDAVGKKNWVCLGFVFPFRNQILFNFDAIDKSDLPEVTKKAVKKLKGGLLHRTNSGVYWTVDLDGNMEWSHPNGAFFRIGEFPTQEEDGQVHVDLTKANRMAKLEGKDSNLAFDTTKAVGQDGKTNSSRKLNAHFEVPTEKGTVQVEINKKTGDVIIRTPKDTAEAKQDANRVTIICGGDATIQSIEGNVTVQSAKKQVLVEAGQHIEIKTDNAGDSSIIIAGNASPDYLPLFEKLMKKFNEHTHVCKGTGSPTDKPKPTLDKGDATRVTKAG